MARSTVVFLVVLVAFAALAHHGGTECAGGEPPPSEIYLPGTEPDHILALRVLALGDRGLVPLQGARVSGWSEPASQASGESSSLLAEGTSNEHGFVNVVWPAAQARPFHWLVDAPGKAVRTVESLSRDVLVARGAPYAIKVLDPMGEPLADARVEYYIYGCPHSPAARAGTTGVDGIVVFEGLPTLDARNPDVHNEWGQFWIQGNGVETRPYGPPRGSRDGGPAVILTDPGRAVTGSVRGEDGKARAGIVVRRHGYPRGPIATTDAEGRFRITGLAAERDPIAFYDPADALVVGPKVIVDDYEAGVPLRVTLARGRATVLGEGESRHRVLVSCRLHSRTDSPPDLVDNVPVCFARLSDGLVVRGESGDSGHGVCGAVVPPGCYKVTVGGGFSAAEEVTEVIEVPGHASLQFVLVQAPNLAIRGGGPPYSQRVELRIPGSAGPATDRAGRGSHLPSEAPALVRIDRGSPRLTTVGAQQSSTRVATIPPPQPTVVHLRIRSADPECLLDGADVQPQDWEAGGSAPEEEAAGQWKWATYACGTQRLDVWCPGFQGRVIPVHLAPSVRVVDLGTIQLHPLRHATLRARCSEWALRGGLTLHWGLAGNAEAVRADRGGGFEVQLGPEPRCGVLRGARVYPYRLRVASGSPHELRLPDGVLEVQIRDPDGQLLEAVTYLDHFRVRSDTDKLRLEGVPAGPHTLVVGARCHLTVVRQFHVAVGDTKSMEVVLPRR